MTTIRTKRKQITVSHLYMHPIILQGVACQTMSKEALPERERERSELKTVLGAEPTLRVMVGLG
jgi:hypothetical protein